MPKEFREGALSFRYPDNWKLEREDSENGWTVSLYSPGTAFLTLSLDADCPEAEAMADSALEAMKEVYPQLESDDVAEQVAGQWAVGHDIYFISLDFTNTCWTRCFDTPDGTALLMWQSVDCEMEQHEAMFQAIRTSLRVANEDE